MDPNAGLRWSIKPEGGSFYSLAEKELRNTILEH